jgi:hypothetical protein
MLARDQVSGRWPPSLEQKDASRRNPDRLTNFQLVCFYFSNAGLADVSNLETSSIADSMSNRRLDLLTKATETDHTGVTLEGTFCFQRGATIFGTKRRFSAVGIALSSFGGRGGKVQARERLARRCPHVRALPDRYSSLRRLLAHV